MNQGRLAPVFNSLALISCLAASALFASGCGKAKATDEQLSKLSQTLDSATRVKGAAPSQTRQNSAEGVRFSFMAADWASKVASVSPPSQLDPSTEKMYSRISEARCDVKAPQFDESTAESFGMSIPQFDIHVGGEACPIKLALTMKVDTSQQAMNASFNCKYQVVDSSYLSLNDVSAMDVKGSLGAKMGSNGSVDGKVDFSGTIHSQKNGDVKVAIAGDISGDQKSQEGKVNAKFEFADFSIELEQKNKSGEETSYSINGHDATAEEFAKALGKLNGSLGGSSTGSSVNHGSYSYELSENGCSTGKQAFSSLDAECEGLQDNTLNHGCALALRKSQFKAQGCPGTFVSH